MPARFRPISVNNETISLVDIGAMSTTAWYQITLIKDSSGTIVIGDVANMLPTSRGLGMQLPNGIPVSLIIGPGDRLYIGSDNLQTAVMAIQQLPPWLEAVERLNAGIQMLQEALAYRGGIRVAR